LLTLLAALTSSDVYATPVTRVITLTVASVSAPYPGGPPPPSPIQVGNIYTGTVTFDDELLTSSGQNLLANMSDYRLQIEDVVWARSPGLLGHPRSITIHRQLRGRARM
jgi:hypothetical protein